MPQDDFDPIEILGRIAAKCDLAAVKDGIPEWAKEFFTELGDCFRMLQLSELARLPDHSEPLLRVKDISDDLLNAEHGRRRRSKAPRAPRTPILKPCVHCGAQLNTRQRRGRCPGCDLTQKDK